MSAPVGPPVPRALPVPESRSAPQERRPSVLGLVSGALLLLLGAAWLLQVTTDVDVHWQATGAVALLAVGFTLLGTARSGRGTGLVPVGAVLTAVVLVSGWGPSIAAGVGTRAEVGVGVGDATETPTTVAGLRPSYSVDVGDLDLDLGALALAVGSSTSVEAAVGTGDLTVRVPTGARVEVHAGAGAGELQVFGARREGVAPVLDVVSDPPAADPAAPRIVLHLSVGLGSVSVTR